jgi:hypothetical protein
MHSQASDFLWMQNPPQSCKPAIFSPLLSSLSQNQDNDHHQTGIKEAGFVEVSTSQWLQWLQWGVTFSQVVWLIGC